MKPKGWRPAEQEGAHVIDKKSGVGLGYRRPHKEGAGMRPERVRLDGQEQGSEARIPEMKEMMSVF